MFDANQTSEKPRFPLATRCWVRLEYRLDEATGARCGTATSTRALTVSAVQRGWFQEDRFRSSWSDELTHGPVRDRSRAVAAGESDRRYQRGSSCTEQAVRSRVARDGPRHRRGTRRCRTGSGGGRETSPSRIGDLVRDVEGDFEIPETDSGTGRSRGEEEEHNFGYSLPGSARGAVPPRVRKVCLVGDVRRQRKHAVVE